MNNNNRRMPKVVLVDDNATMRSLLRAILRNEHYEVVGEASDGKTALALIERVTPDIVALDMEMPGMSGMEVLEALRQAPPLPAVVVISSTSDKDSIRHAFDLGALGYVTKPFNEGRIVEVFAQLTQTLAGRRRTPEPIMQPSVVKRGVLIDENAADRGRLRNILEQGGYFIAAEADGGFVGLTTVESELPDFVCLAVDLPQIDGLNVLSCLHAVHPDLPIVMVSAHADRDTVTRAIAGGVKGYVIKPFDPARVLAAVAQAVGLQAA